MIPVDSQTMREVAPTFSGEWAERQAATIAAAGEVLRPKLEAYQITTRLRISHFLAQTCHESAGFRATEEFASGEAYEGRADLGNVRDGDGPRYKGRGLLMLIGRANYREYGKALQADLEGNPALAAEPVLSLRIACEYWKRHDVNAACDQDDLISVTRLVNGGLNGLPDWRAYTAKAKTALARIEGFQLSGGAPPQARPVLRRGSQGEEVASLQTALRKLDFAVTIDGDFGPGTEVAVARFQSERGVDVDGIVGAQRWAALLSAQADARYQSA
jgi:putative chitinase